MDVDAMSWENCSLTLQFIQLVVLTVNSIATIIHPEWGEVTPSLPFSSLVYLLLIFCCFLLFPFLVCFTYSLLLSIPSLSTRIVTTPFPGLRRSNLGLVCFVNFVLSVSLS